ncbi:hypothetical protein VC83_01553 [Pseudogymnoascus destructans]|uniref:DNA-binding protein RAP1 n=2 Tax=Pseudogymnoascus destructans TaxID=655981 RepID=L8FXJ2_PSED2|nr:uncharacterized protein VC83_01553 [Pseudogymnoascus destructans]ELR05690.1 hypothetical protein GMDG_07533 [Pseudogymnoascus destructans 20631-21]OAF61750.1 hypothetical protein VC83_01553 [Pseudogymnoascus destructans]
MAAAVYEGVAGGGDLFQGQKFFISQRVPARTELIKNVQRNGGFVVPLEKNADVLIADHAKPTLAPASSVSWKYLEQSMKKGELEDLEAHRINSPGKTRLPGGPQKLTRTPFRYEDSMAISIWVAKAERIGLAVRGNEVYEQFAEKNPRHTAQSWRDHWIKQLSSKPRPEIDMNSTDWPVKRKEDRPRRAIPSATRSENVATTPNASGARRPTPGSPSLPVASYSPENEHASTEEAPITKDVPFTEEDIETLEGEYSDLVKITPGTLVYAWEVFANIHRRHTAGDWCNYYHNVFKPRKCQEDEEKESNVVNPKPDRGQVSTPKTYITPVRAAASSRSPTETRGTARHRKLGEDGAISSKSPESVTSKDQSQVGASSDKAKFLENLKELSSAIGCEIEPSFNLYGRNFELYDLWSVVNKPEFRGFQKVEEADGWLQVALKLGINTYRYEMAHTALKQKYRDKLVDFDTHISAKKNCEKGRTFPTKSTEPVTPVTASSARKDREMKERASVTKSTEPATPVTAIPRQTHEQAHILSSGVRTPKTLRQATVSPQESANKDVAAQRIRQSLGHGELAFLQSISEFAWDCLPDPVTFEPIVSKRRIRLFNVWTASLPLLAHFDDIESTEVWDDFATQLGFETSAHPSAPDELRQICEDFLMDFYEFFIQREQEKIKEEEAVRQQPEEQGQSEEEVEESSDDNPEPPSLAFQTAGRERQKRPHDQDSISAVVEPRPTSSHSHSKRPRISKGKERADEIPSTPEHIYNGHLNNDGKLPDHPNAQNKKLIETNIEYFAPPSSSEELGSSPTRQLRSEAIDYTPPSQKNNDEEATQLQSESQCNEGVDEFVERCSVEGFDIETIKQVLKITTMEVELAERLLSDYANGLEIPKNVAGVWTEEDDNGVKGHMQSRGYKRSLKKHGEIRCLKRKEFLEDWEKCVRASEKVQADA